MGVEGQHHAPAALPPGKTRYPLYRRLGGPQGRSGRVRKISPPPGFDPLTVQPVASRYTDWAIPAAPLTLGACIFFEELLGRLILRTYIKWRQCHQNHRDASCKRVGTANGGELKKVEGGVAHSGVRFRAFMNILVHVDITDHGLFVRTERERGRENTCKTMALLSK